MNSCLTNIGRNRTVPFLGISRQNRNIGFKKGKPILNGFVPENTRKSLRFLFVECFLFNSQA